VRLAAGEGGATVPSWLEGRPFVIAFAVLLGIVFLRAQATYWAGRGVVTGAMHTRLAGRLTGPRLTRAIAALNRWGLPVVTISFLTVGFQTVINAGAGLTRMRWGRYTLAMLPGCAAWAAIYATVGLAAVTAWLTLNPAPRWGVIGCVIALAGGIVTAVLLRRRRAALPAEPVTDSVGDR
jgi:membrane protein DedA with SNARE-associated domain